MAVPYAFRKGSVLFIDLLNQCVQNQKWVRKSSTLVAQCCCFTRKSGPGQGQRFRDIWSRSSSSIGIDEDQRYEKGDFGDYQIVTVGKVSAKRRVPVHINKPEYYKTGQPKWIQTTSPPISLTDSDSQKLREACKLARFILNSLVDATQVGITTDALDSLAHDLILKHNAYPSPLNYRGFPKSICTSVNNVACHGIPDDRALLDGDIINIDVTVYLNGFHGDCSETVCVGNVDAEGRKLVEATKDCLYRGISVCGPNVPFRQIGKSIEKLALEKGLAVVPAFTGHGIGAHFHCAPDIYHIDYDFPGVMKPGIAFTIEPVLSQGTEMVEILEDGWTAITVDKARTAQFEHTVLITDSGVEILTNQ